MNAYKIAIEEVMKEISTIIDVGGWQNVSAGEPLIYLDMLARLAEVQKLPMPEEDADYLRLVVAVAALNQMKRSRGLAETAVVSPARPDVSEIAFRLLSSWELASPFGFACKDPVALKDFLACVEELRSVRRVDHAGASGEPAA